MRTNAVAHPWWTSLAWSAVSRVVVLSILGFVGCPSFVSADDSAWKADSLIAAMALTAVVGGIRCLRRAGTERRWRAALNRYAEQEQAKGTRSQRDSNARPQPEVPTPHSRKRPDPVRSYTERPRISDNRPTTCEQDAGRESFVAQLTSGAMQPETSNAEQGVATIDDVSEETIVNRPTG
jgi:hypothetical protein